MENKQITARMRHIINRPVWALLIYYGIMNLAVMAVMVLDIAFGMIRYTGENVDAAMEQIVERALSNGLGYFIAMGIGALALQLWKKKEFCFHTLWQRNSKMTARAFFSIAALFFSIQAVSQILTFLLELLLNGLGLSLTDTMEQVSGTGDTMSMFLYTALFAPIGEEILFRGLLQRSFAPLGKKFAIFASAFLFGLFHGNLVQTPYAFLVGLVLGYVTAEYSIFWAILLHILNNMVLADLMTRLGQILPPGAGDLITLLFVWSCAVAAVVILICCRKDVKAYLRDRKMHPLCLKAFFTSPAVLVFTAFMAASILMTLGMLFPL